MTQSIYSVATEDLDLDTFDVDSQFEMTSPDMTIQIPDYLSDSEEGPKMKPLAKAEDAETKLLSIDSLLPLLKFLPGLVLKNSVYHINGSISKEDGDALIQYAQRIGEFSLCDQNAFRDPISDTKAELEGRIGLDVIIRLIKLQSLCTQTNTLFPSLKRLRIDNAKSAMDYLDLFITPSLEAIEIMGVSEDHFDAFYSFFTTLADEVPGLSSLILGPGPIPNIVMGMSLKFSHLQCLEFVNISTSFNFDFLENIGRLESLQSLTVDMGNSDGGLYVSRASDLMRTRLERERVAKEARQKEIEEERMKVIQETRIKELEEQLRKVQEAPLYSDGSILAAGEPKEKCEDHSWGPPGSKPNLDANVDGWGFGGGKSIPVCDSEIPPAPTAGKKKKFKKGDCRIQPPLSSMFGFSDKPDTPPDETGFGGFWGSPPPPITPPSVTPPLVTAPRTLMKPEGGEMSKGLRTLTLVPPPRQVESPIAEDISRPKCRVQPATEVRSPSPSVWSRASSPIPSSDVALSPITHDIIASFGDLFCALKALVVRGSQSLVEELVSMISSRTLQSMSVTFSTDAPASPLSRSTKEVAANISSIAQVRWRNTLSKLSIGICAREPVAVLHTSHFDPQPSKSLTLKNLLCLPKLEHLDLSRMPSLSIESGFDYLSKGSTTKLKTLFLPDDATAPGISLSRLRVLAEACPDLVSLRCKLKHLSNIPAPRDLPLIPFSHTLETLLIGNAEAHPDPQRVLDIARYLDFLFPHLKTIETISGQNEAQWMSILSVVKVCQAVRLDERERFGAGIH